MIWEKESIGLHGLLHTLLQVRVAIFKQNRHSFGVTQYHFNAKLDVRKCL